MPKEGYNLGMVNNVSEITLSGFIPQEPDLTTGASSGESQDIVAVDILYKDEASPNVYVVDTIKNNQHNSSIWTNNEYVVKSEIIKRVLPSNQLLRPWDNVPKKALAQEIVGNRLVYANYEQNMDLQNVPVDLNFVYMKHPNRDIFDEIGQPSIKSLRSYQLGIAYEDKYGRQTPVLTNKDCVLNVPITQSHIPTLFDVLSTS